VSDQGVYIYIYIYIYISIYICVEEELADLGVTALAGPRRNCMESQLRQQNKAVSSAGLRPKSDCSGKAQRQLYSNLHTRPLVREGATKLQTCNCLNEISRRKQTLVNCPSLGSIPRHTD
jgi:hypothetical protein